jgi:hypothetical protein
LETARRAAAAIESSLDGDEAALEDYANWLSEDFAAYLPLQRYYYEQVARFPVSPFWRRRGDAESSRADWRQAAPEAHTGAFIA